MRKLLYLFLLIALLILIQIPVSAQYKEQGFTIGVEGGGLIGINEAKDHPIRAMGRMDFGFPILDRLQGSIGAGSARVAGSIGTADEFSSDLVPVDFRFRLALLSTSRVIFYGYGGAGWVHYSLNAAYPATRDPNLGLGGWTGFIPFGIGFLFRADEHWSFRLDGGDNYTFSDALNPVLSAAGSSDQNDSYGTFAVGASYSVGRSNKDADGDGLRDKLEKQLGTNSKNVDTDGDRLADGEEYNHYKTDPSKGDTDNDGLGDGEEVLVFKTNPLNVDSDDDGLKDGEEISSYKTDPLQTDTDGDGLKDGDEVLTYKTSPNNADFDGDGLKDGEEVNSYKTHALTDDTDGGKVSDGVEVARGTDPLNPEDDLAKEEPKVEVLKVEKGQAIILEGIVFQTASSEILPASKEILMKAYNTLDQNSDIEVEIQGHTDNVGKHDYNTTLSQSRADAVKSWLVNAGISTNRITTEGFSFDKPLATNDTPEGRQQNRRIEFLRTQ
ncbi:MAG: OmpA family protein [Candidatus Zixiibacteriota bacterium]|nr:MAG: OmpA family protein [candidate division Zixibacteria bacterium]